MKSENDSARSRPPGDRRRTLQTPAVPRAAGKPFGPPEIFAIGFGLFLGLALLKFGNPVVLEAKISAPTSFSEFWSYAWPPRWGFWLLVPFAPAGAAIAFARRPKWPGTAWLWVLPTVWFGWQLLSATHTVDGELTGTTLWQFGGCFISFLLGAWVLRNEKCLHLLLIGLLAAFAFCLVRAVNQRLFEFPRDRQILLEGERTGWTNFAPDLLVEMKHDGTIITTNGMDVANPAILKKYGEEPPASADSFHRLLHRFLASTPRVHGTLVYANALAGAILLLLPLSLWLAFAGARGFRRPTRFAVISLTAFLGAAGLFWTGSKSGWLIAILIGGTSLFRLNWPPRVKWAVLGLIIIAGAAVFGLRFHRYFASGATSVGARFDYWRAAVQITGESPVFGSGPGTFQRPYAQIKSPDAEMARLAHNDYLEQFSDSGVVGGSSYLAWIILLLTVLGRRAFKHQRPEWLALFLGLAGWFAQGVSEFGLYIPALAWTSFALAGCLLALTGKPFDKNEREH